MFKSKPIFIGNSKVFPVDCDDTLIMGDLSKYPYSERIVMDGNGREFEAVVNQKNVNLVKKLYKMGYTVLVWSKTGAPWAKEVVEKLHLTDYVDIIMAKPLFYLDDKDCSVWMGERVWRDVE